MQLSTLLATWFGSGLIKPAPGTWGSLAALPAAWGLFWIGDQYWIGGQWLLAVAAVLLFPIGVWAANAYDRQHGSHDASEIVIDEVVGVWLTLAIAPQDWTHGDWFHVLAGFLLFRLFDIVKPWPIRWADKKVSGGFGVMLDDVLAAGYASAALWGLSTAMAWSTGI